MASQSAQTKGASSKRAAAQHWQTGADEFYIVGFTASASGAESVSAVRQFLPPGTGRTLRVQHPDPKHASKRSELLLRALAMLAHVNTDRIMDATRRSYRFARRLENLQTWGGESSAAA